MSKIATEQEAYNIGKTGTPVSNKCCTKARAEALGCTIIDRYSSNQLVKLNDLNRQVYRVSFLIRNVSTSDNSVHCLTNGAPTRSHNEYDTWYCFESIYEEITSTGIIVQSYTGGNSTTIAVGGRYYWYLYDLNKNQWVLLGAYTCTLANNAYYATM